MPQPNKKSVRSKSNIKLKPISGTEVTKLPSIKSASGTPKALKKNASEAVIGIPTKDEKMMEKLTAENSKLQL